MKKEFRFRFKNKEVELKILVNKRLSREGDHSTVKYCKKRKEKKRKKRTKLKGTFRLNIKRAN
jgi:hypothetical protein